MKNKNQIDDLLKKLEKYRLVNGDIPTKITSNLLKEEIENYLDKNISLDDLYYFTQSIFDEVTYTNPIDNQLFQSVHDILRANQEKVPKQKAKEIIQSIYKSLSN